MGGVMQRVRNRPARDVLLGPRSRTLAMKRINRIELREGAIMNPPTDVARPATRGDCFGGERPCPWVACRHHLFLDVNPETGSIKFNYPARELEDFRDTCSLDVADRASNTLEEVGVLMNLTRERVRQIELIGLHALKGAAIDAGVAP